MNAVYIVIGYKLLNYTNRAGRQVNGLRLYVTYDDTTAVGACCDAFFISGASVPPALGSAIEIYHNKYGKCTGFRAVE